MNPQEGCYVMTIDGRGKYLGMSNGFAIVQFKDGTRAYYDPKDVLVGRPGPLADIRTRLTQSERQAVRRMLLAPVVQREGD